MNYLNKALDTYNTAIVSSIYYVFFTVLTIAASVIMYKDWHDQTANQISFELMGFVLIVVGVYMLHATKDADAGCEDGLAHLVGGFSSLHEGGKRKRTYEAVRRPGSLRRTGTDDTRLAGWLPGRPHRAQVDTLEYGDAATGPDPDGELVERLPVPPAVTCSSRRESKEEFRTTPFTAGGAARILDKLV